eukprot:TRINITY_DN3826_c0_g1_i1.p1 TRINITY_DN3826_c0_g1~~TRINITY_DN3826_c0_g1_i1.p1  ORF type:complete len:278 (+),score=41.12 TRINITY_DN3826_c0_g1_i1:116-949(+)
MPLVVLCGLPCSGKTTRAKELGQYLTDEKCVVQYVDFESIGISRNDLYKDSASEKKGNSAVKAAASRYLSEKRVVIVDYNNFIKGFRYELWCAAREATSTCCVIFCDTTPELCVEWDNKRAEKDRYKKAILEDLLKRLEKPDANKKWDKPLFTVKPTDKLPLKDIGQALLSGKAEKPTCATIQSKLEDSNLLYEIDRVTQDISKTVLSAIGESTWCLGDDIKVPHSPIVVKLTRKVSVSELNRLKRQFLKMAEVTPFKDKQNTAQAFVEFINTNHSL